MSELTETTLHFSPSPLNSSERPFFDVAEDNSQPPLLLIHGFLMSRALWNDNIDDLSQFSRLIRMELLSHGRSPSPEAADAYSLDSYIDAMESQRRALGYGSWTLCAQSLGAALAFNYAIQCPSSVSGLIFTNSTAGLGRPEDRASASLPEEFRAGLRAGRRDLLLQMTAHASQMRYISDDLKAALIEDSELLDPAGIERNLKYRDAFIGIRSKDASFDFPILLVNGALERKFQTFKDWALQTYPEWEVEDLEGGHSINAQKPQAFNAAVRSFFHRHISSPT